MRLLFAVSSGLILSSLASASEALSRSFAMRRGARSVWGLLLGLGLLLVAGPGWATTTTIDATDSGWYADSGLNNNSGPTPENYVAGRFGFPEYRDFFVFDLSSVPALETVTAVTLRLEQPGSPDPGYSSPDLTEAFELVQVSTSIPLLVAGPTSIPTYNDLGDGTVYGAINVSAITNGTLVDILFNAAAIAAVDGGAGLFAIGGHVTTLSGAIPANEFTWGSTGNTSTPVRQLIVESTLPIPEPAPAALLMLGLVTLAARRRHDR